MSNLVYSRKVHRYLEMDIDFCVNSFSNSPCTATGEPCYQGYTSCKDRTNYSKTSHTYKFSSVGAPMPAGSIFRPYIKSVSPAATEINPEVGLGTRSSVTITMMDEVDNDTEMDPYVNSRSATPGGTFWLRFIARNRNYSGRFARLSRAYFTTDSYNTSELNTELYIIDQIKGPDTSGAVQIVLKDIMKLADRAKYPVPTSGKLVNSLGTNDMFAQVTSGYGYQYPGSGYFRVGDQIIRYSGKSYAQGWNFDADVGFGIESWVQRSCGVWSAYSCSLVSSYHRARISSMANSSYIAVGGLNLYAGIVWRYVAANIKRVSAGSGWIGRLAYSTPTHSYQPNSRYCTVSEPAGISSDYQLVVWDMFNLNVGSVDWRDSYPAGLQLFIDGGGAQYDIDWIGFSTINSPTADILTWPSASYRSQFRTTAANQKPGDAVQVCAVWSGIQVTSVIQDLLIAAGIPSSYIATSDMALQEDLYLGEEYRITTCIPGPEETNGLLKELCLDTNAALWVSPSMAKIKYQVFAPQPPSLLSSAMLTDSANLIDGTVAISRLEPLRQNLVGVYYDLTNGTADAKKANNYLSADLHIDQDAMSTNGYNDERAMVEYSRWFGPSNIFAAQRLASRRIRTYRDAPDQIEFSVDAKDGDIVEGMIIGLECNQLCDFAGNPKSNRVLITRRQEEESGRIKLVARTTIFNQNFGFIAPNSYPAFTSATSAQKLYAFICNSAAGMSDGSSGYIIS